VARAVEPESIRSRAHSSWERGYGSSITSDADPIALEQTRVIESEGVTHLRYRVVR
jgi:hypothetical protein